MKVYKTAKLRILGSHNIKPTIDIYRKALGFIIRVCYNENSVLFKLSGKNRVNFIENLIHATSKTLILNIRISTNYSTNILLI